ncbi:MAG: hypothetical protein RJQ21_09170 [Rhodospirillales bacterium]
MSGDLRYVAALPVWGDWYVDFFHAAALPTLLSPGNLPAFATQSTFTALLYTRPQDLDRLSRHPRMHDLARFADIRFKALPGDIEEFATGADGIRRKLTVMSRCLEVAIRAAEEDPGLVAMFPLADLLYADGALGAVHARMQAGCRAVGIVTPHLSAEAVLAAGDELTAIAGTPEGLLRFTLDHAHESFRRQFIASRPFSGRPSQFYVDGGTAGFAARAIHLHPLAVRPVRRVNRLSASIDTAYFFDAVPDTADRHVIADSREALVVECSRDGYLADLGDWPAFDADRLAGWVRALALAPGQAGLLDTDIRFHAGVGDLDAAGRKAGDIAKALRLELGPA